MPEQYQYKEDFPFFHAHPEDIYLDSSATTQKPAAVIECLASFYDQKNVNAGRGNYMLSTKLVQEIEEVRKQVSRFVHAESREEIFFSRGATDAQYRIAQACINYFNNGDEILYSPLDHRSFVLPWFQLQKQLQAFGITIHLIPYSIKQVGTADIKDIFNKVTPQTRCINITHIHNVFGSDTDVFRLKELREKGILINVDAAQSVGHMDVNVETLGADILSFSGHKMFAPLGTGVLFMRTSFQEQLDDVDHIELGTKDYAGILGLGEAISYIEEIGIGVIHAYLIELTQYAITRLKELSRIQFTKGLADCPCDDGYGIISFNIEGLEPMDIAFFLAQKNIMVRAGDHCSMTPGDEVNAVRVSMHIYNSKADIDRLIEALKQIVP